MINLTTSLTKSPGEVFRTINFPQKPKLKLLLILSPSALEKGEICFTGMDLIIAPDIVEAKRILHLSDGNFPDAIICDAGINRKSVSDLSAFLRSKKLSLRIPLLLLVLNEKLHSTFHLNNSDGVDDIISSNTSVTDLADKIKILKKYKSLRDKLPYFVEMPKRKIFNRKYLLKRSIDVALSIILLIALSPLILLIALAIKLESRGPVFYKSLRAGKWYKVFTFYKFRTMVANADSMVKDLHYMNEYKDFQKSFFFKVKDDPRVTRVGRILRRTSLDELPQLINVLKGDMSLVGNRPLPLYEASTITVDKSAKRFFAPAGITGLWQVEGRSNYNLTVQERINMDIDYANNHSLLFDLKILLKTPKELIQKHNV